MNALLEYINSLGTYQKTTAQIILSVVLGCTPIILLNLAAKNLGPGGFWGAFILIMLAAFYIIGELDKAEK